MAEPQSAPARVRPSSVTISSYLLILFAVIQVIGLIIVMTVIGTIQDVYREAFAGTEAEGAETVVVIFGVGVGLIGLLFAIGLVVLAVLNNKGKNPSRIVTWVVGGIALCCTGFGLLGNAIGGSMGGRTSGDMPSQDEINRRLDAALPSWYEPISTGLTVIGLLVLLAALILLALPRSNEFFRRPEPVWTPPVPGAAYPGYPQTPGHPQPPAPGYPPAPGHPQSGAPGNPQSPGDQSSGHNPSPPSGS